MKVDLKTLGAHTVHGFSITAVDATRLGQELSKHSRPNTTQKSVLEAAFASNCYPNKTTFMQVAQETGLFEAKVRNWFMNKRSFKRRDMKYGLLQGKNSVCGNH